MATETLYATVAQEKRFGSWIHSWRAMSAVIQENPPKSFVTDFTKHDRAVIKERDIASPFVWIVYESGTHLAYSAKYAADLERITLPLGRAYYWTGWISGPPRLIPCDSVADAFSRLEETLDLLESEKRHTRKNHT